LNTCIHRHKHRSSNTIMVKKTSTVDNCQSFLGFRPFRGTWAHIRFLVVFLFVLLDLFFYVVFCRSLSVPLFFVFCILFFVVLLLFTDSDFPFGIFKLFLCLHGDKINWWWTDFINVNTWNLKGECQAQI
jgi:hypothetical protein